MFDHLRRWLTAWVMAAGLTGWLLASTLADPSWLTMAETPVALELARMVKMAFLDLLRLVIAPVIFFSLVAGVLSVGDASRMRQLGAATVSWYLATTALATALGLGVVLLFPPSMWAPAPSALSDLAPAATGLALLQPGEGGTLALLAGILDRALVNPVAAMAELNVLGIVLNALLFGVAILLVVPAGSPLRTMLEHLTQATYKVLGWVVLTMPLGVLAIVFELTIGISGALLQSLAGFVLMVLSVTLLHGLVVLPLLCWWRTGEPPLRVLLAISRPMAVAFATSSSTATLPVSLETARNRLGVRDAVGSVVLPLGATMNMDGTALFEGIAAVFLAYLFGIDLGTTGIVAIFLMAMLSSIGAPGMPTAAMAGMQMVLLAAGIPLEGIAILLLVERPLDTVRTAVNVAGDLMGSLVVHRATLPTASELPASGSATLPLPQDSR